MLQLTRNGLVLNGRLDALRNAFATQHCVVLENLLEPVLLEKIQRHIDRAQWNCSAFEDGFSGTEFTLDEPVTCNLLGVLLNNQNFLNAIRMITGCTQISEFSGRVYRMAAGPQHHLSWHDDIDLKEKREVGFSMNLSTDVFRGGTFELRNRSTRAPLAQVNNTGFGDALLFRISTDLQHRVTQVVGKAPKTACAGWFRATGKSFLPELAGRLNT
jgi:2OG-Fe(II) oxygenase superfamily